MNDGSSGSSLVVRRLPHDEFARRTDEHRGPFQCSVVPDGRYGDGVRPGVRPEDRRVVRDRVRDEVPCQDVSAVVVDVLHDPTSQTPTVGTGVLRVAQDRVGGAGSGQRSARCTSGTAVGQRIPALIAARLGRLCRSPLVELPDRGLSRRSGSPPQGRACPPRTWSVVAMPPNGYCTQCSRSPDSNSSIARERQCCSSFRAPPGAMPSASRSPAVSTTADAPAPLDTSHVATLDVSTNRRPGRPTTRKYRVSDAGDGEGDVIAGPDRAGGPGSTRTIGSPPCRGTGSVQTGRPLRGTVVSC